MQSALWKDGAVVRCCSPALYTGIYQALLKLFTAVYQYAQQRHQRNARIQLGSWVEQRHFPRSVRTMQVSAKKGGEAW